MKQPYARLVAILLVSMLISVVTGCRRSPTAPTAQPACSVRFQAALYSGDRPPQENVTIQTIIDGHAFNPIRLPLYSASPLVDRYMGSDERTPGRHVAEIVIIDQPVSPTKYELSRVAVVFYSYGTGWICGAAIRTVALPDQTATLATGERFLVPFEL